MSGLDFPDNFMAIFGFKRVSAKPVQGGPMNTGMRPVADKDDILTAFEKLIDENGKTTTLEVKASLRSDGFWVKQDGVSDIIAEYVDYDSNEYTFTIDRNHRVYEPIANIVHMPAKASVPSFVGKPKTVAKVGDWEATDGTDTQTYCDMTRNQARYLFSKQFDVPYISVNAKLA